MQDKAWIGRVFLFLQLLLASHSEADFSVSLELQGGRCSDQLTLICRHSDKRSSPLWIHNGTLESGGVLGTAFPGAVYTVQALTEHTATITGMDSVRALDGYLIQCAYPDVRDNLTKSNAVQFSFIPPDYRQALSFKSSADVTRNFSSNSTCTYSYEESCRRYPKCIPYFTVEHTVSPPSAVSNSSSGCIVSYTIHNLMRCVSYQSTATALLGNQRGNTVVQGVTIMLGPGQFTITSVSIGADRDLINVTYMENEFDCPGYPTERYTVDVDGVQVADLTADAVQSLAINHADGSVTLSLPLSQALPEDALTLNMTKYNTVPTNRSDAKGNIVTEMVTWTTSDGLDLREEPLGRELEETTTPVLPPGVIGGGVSAGIVGIIAVIGVIAVIVCAIKWRSKMKKRKKK